MKPEYLHAISNHVLVIGVALGIFALVLALLLKSRQAQIVALAVVLVSSAAAYPVLFLGQQAYKSVRGIADEPGQDWLDVHMERAESTIYIYYALMLVAGAALAVPPMEAQDRHTAGAHHFGPLRSHHGCGRLHQLCWRACATRGVSRGSTSCRSRSSASARAA